MVVPKRPDQTTIPEAIVAGRDATPRSQGEGLVTYRLTYRCKHCGKEWTKLSEKEVDLPESYIKDEYGEA